MTEISNYNQICYIFQKYNIEVEENNKGGIIFLKKGKELTKNDISENNLLKKCISEYINQEMYYL